MHHLKLSYWKLDDFNALPVYARLASTATTNCREPKHEPLRKYISGEFFLFFGGVFFNFFNRFLPERLFEIWFWTTKRALKAILECCSQSSLNTPRGAVHCNSKNYRGNMYSTAKNTVISPDFLVWKLCLSAKLPHQEIRWNYDIFRSVSNKKRGLSSVISIVSMNTKWTVK